jgi:membrane protease YdiL (CAAX protease family)
MHKQPPTVLLSKKRHFFYSVLWLVAVGLAGLILTIIRLKGDIAPLESIGWRPLLAAILGVWVYHVLFARHIPKWAPAIEIDARCLLNCAVGVAAASAAVILVYLIQRGLGVHVIFLTPDYGYLKVIFERFSWAILEELAFRGLLLYLIYRFLPNTLAILLTSLAFALVHVDGVRDNWTLISIFISGVTYAVLVNHWQNLWPCIVMHSLYNWLILLVATTPNFQSQTTQNFSYASLAVAVANAIVCAAALILISVRRRAIDSLRE